MSEVEAPQPISHTKLYAINTVAVHRVFQSSIDCSFPGPKLLRRDPFSPPKWLPLSPEFDFPSMKIIFGEWAISKSGKTEFSCRSHPAAIQRFAKPKSPFEGSAISAVMARNPVPARRCL
jgi:hypothetical protein